LNCYGEFTQLKQRLEAEVDDHVIDDISVQNRNEKKYFNLGLTAFKDMRHVRLDHSIYLHSFEADIVVYVADPKTGKTIRIINIEIDGEVHRSNIKKKRFCKMRDRYLIEKHGVEIVRVDLMSVEEQRKSDKSIVKWFQSLI
jgi:very-short-patch-repair endonuclease